MTITDVNLHAMRRVHYDAVVVGARAAGAATAMLLARRGLRVLAIDKARAGSDTLSTHALMRGAVNQLDRWGLLDEVVRAGTPAVDATTIRYGADELTIDMTETGSLYAPRRTVLDPILVTAAREAGAVVRHETTLVDLVRTGDDGRVVGAVVAAADGTARTIGCDLLIGADGLFSAVARKVDAPVTRTGASAGATIMRYVEGTGLPTDRYHWLYAVDEAGERTAAGVIPTNGAAHCLFVTIHPDRFDAERRNDVPATFDRILGRMAPDVADVVATGTAVGPPRSWPGRPGQFRKAHGPGWALVGDAGYFKDPAAAHGISDALRDAELLADAVVDGNLDRYEHLRDHLSGPLFDGLESLASLRWTLDELPAIHLEVAKAMSDEHARLAELLGRADRQVGVATTSGRAA